MRDFSPDLYDISGTTGRPGRKKVAVVGGGISGLGAAWLLASAHDVVLFEANDYVGGHSNTVDAQTALGPIPVDTGFIVYNASNYPNLTALFDHLGVDTQSTVMSFSASLEGGRFEYSGSGLKGLLAQRSNVLRPRFWSMVRDILRFYEAAPGLLDVTGAGGQSLGAYLADNGYGRPFIDDHLLPMAAAIWSAPQEQMMAFPAASFARFFANHGLLQVKDRPKWRTVVGGSREYVRSVLNSAPIRIRTNSAIQAVCRTGAGVTLVDNVGRCHAFDEVVLATHADRSLAMLESPTADEQHLLSAFAYQKNRAILHSDPALMPRRKRAWAAWNYRRPVRQADAAVSVTYWMNALQHLDARAPLFVSLNPDREPDPGTVHFEADYDHPLFDMPAMAAQRELWRIQGQNRVWYCGAYFGYGFHEDGLQSGLAVAEALGGVSRPWDVPGQSARIHLGPDGVMAHEGHSTESPLKPETAA